MDIELEGWEDGVHFRKTLSRLDRWAVHASSSVTVSLAGTTTKIHQQPQALHENRIGVGACLWDASFVLTSFLGNLDPLSWAGARVVELGAGLGLPGLFLVQQGAKVTFTDRASVLPLLRENVQQNARDGGAGARGAGHAQVMELDWHAALPSTMRALTAPLPDYVIAADCLYVDPGGSTPDAQAFVGVCAALSGPGTRCYVALEARSSDVMQAFFSCATAAGFHLV